MAEMSILTGRFLAVFAKPAICDQTGSFPYEYVTLPLDRQVRPNSNAKNC
jgi:hypothetical protein